MNWPLYILKRIALAVVQVGAIVAITFIILRAIPANPAYRIASFNTSPENIRAIEERLGLDKPLWRQMWDYIVDVAHGQMGTSILTGNDVWFDMRQRVPATLELIVIGLGIAVAIAIPLGVWTARRRGGAVRKVVRGYSMLAGSQPDYWWALALVFIFFVILGVAPGPVGQLGIGVPPPDQVTGSMLIDSLATRNGTAFNSALSQLVLPVATVVLVYMGPILKMTTSSYGAAMQHDSVRLMRASGVGEARIALMMFRVAAAPVVTTIGITFTFLLGGLALIETVFTWNGVAQYAVGAAVASDYPGMQGVVLVIAAMAALGYLVTDIAQMIVDPRLRSVSAE